jgi:beta-lactamase class D
MVYFHFDKGYEMIFKSRVDCIFLVLILAETIAGCNGNQTIFNITQTPNKTESPVITANSRSTEKSELEKYFEGNKGAFVLFDLNNNSYIRYNPSRCAERFIPASTYKIMNSLIGLETGVIPDENYVIKWDGTKYDILSWNQDQTLKTAIQNSVV